MTVYDEELKSLATSKERGERLAYIDPEFVEELASELLQRRKADRKWNSRKNPPTEEDRRCWR